MTIQDKSLQKALTEPYSLAFFSQNVLQPIFGESLTVFASPVAMTVNLSERRIVKEVRKYGELKLTDYRQIDLYEVALVEHVIVERNKVSIGAVVKKLIVGNNAVLVSFHYPDQPDRSWRFSFIAKDQVIEDGTAKKIETNPKRYTYILGPYEHCRTAAERFNKLSLETDLNVNAFQDAFSVEKLSRSFFDEYKDHYDAFVKHLSKREIKASVFNGDEKAIRDFAKKLLGRIVFLYFVQKKGWLGASDEKWQDGNPNFVEDLFVTSGRKETFYPLWLRTLFYDSLNNPNRTNDTFQLPDGRTAKVPYLNGGLFEDDDPKGILTFPPRLFEDLFEFFNQYNFTIYEDSPDDHIVAVDPEMLGHIFENLLEDNKDKGAYYTPKEIVHYMCQESLVQYLATKLDISRTASYEEPSEGQTSLLGNESKKGQLDLAQKQHRDNFAISQDDIDQFIKQKETTPQIVRSAADINNLLDAVKICDPAIGSGAFPMGLLHEIFNAKQALREIAGLQELRSTSNVQMKEEIIQNSIYGVDIEKGAVDIARLRFWLSLIVDEDKPRPLPNLDFKIVVGDSLLPRFEDEVVDIDWETRTATSSTEKLYGKMKEDLRNLVGTQKKYFSIKDEAQKANYKQIIRDLKIEILLNQLRVDKAKYEHKHVANEEMFGGGGKDQTGKFEVNLRIASYDSSIRKLEQLRKHPKTPLNFFDWKLDFPEIMNSSVANRPGFDIVIGNPPWVSMKGKFGIEESKRNNFEILQSFYSVSSYRPNLFEFFIVKCLDLVCQEGAFCFIIPDRLGYNSYLDYLRLDILNKKQILEIVYKWHFETIIADTMTLLIKNRSFDDYHIKVKNRPNEPTLLMTKSEYLRNPGYVFRSYSSEKIRRLIKKIDAGSEPLRQLSQTATGFIGVTSLIKKNRTNRSQIPIAKGECIAPFRMAHQLYYEFKEENIKGGTKDQRKLGIKEKILVRKTGDQIIAALDTSGIYPEQSAYFLYDIEERISKYVLLGLLNSKLMTWYFLNQLVTNEDSTPQIKKCDLEALPIKGPNDPKAMIAVVEKILSEKTSDLRLRDRLDQIIYELYSLTDEEALIIEGKITN